MFNCKKSIMHTLASIACGASAAIIIGGTSRSLHFSPAVCEAAAAVGLIIYTVVGLYVFRTAEEISDYFNVPSSRHATVREPPVVSCSTINGLFNIPTNRSGRIEDIFMLNQQKKK